MRIDASDAFFLDFVTACVIGSMICFSMPENPTETETKTDRAVIVAAKEAEEKEDGEAERNERGL